nr:polyprotein [Cacao mild mosaic virus]
MTSRTETMTQPQTGINFEDQIRGYRTGQRRRYNWARQARRLRNRIRRSPRQPETLETQIDPQAELSMSLQRRASIVPAEVLYHSRQDDINHRVYQHWSEEAVNCTDGQQIDRTLVTMESFSTLNRAGFRYIHIGVIQVRLQILHRREMGTLAYVVFRDNRLLGDQAILAQMEVSLADGGHQMIYVVPDIMMTVGDFYRNIQISIQTRGYGNWRNAEANLLVTRGLVGRLSNTSNVGFEYSISNVTDYLTSHGVRAIPGKRVSESEHLGRSWILREPEVSIIQQPTIADTRNLPNGSVSVRFGGYGAAPETSRTRFDENDNEIMDDDESQIAEEVHVMIIDEDDEEWEELNRQMVADFAEEEQKHTEPIIAEEDIYLLPGMEDLLNISTHADLSNGNNLTSAINGFIIVSIYHNGKDMKILKVRNDTKEIKLISKGDIIGQGKVQQEEVHFTEEEARAELKKLIAGEEVYMEAESSVQSGSYRLPTDATMGPPIYPPARQRFDGPSTSSIPMDPPTYRAPPRAKVPDYQNWWNLPTAQINGGAMFIIPSDFSKFDDVFMRWESITKNVVALQNFSDNKDKAEFIENLLGETEKLAWIQWRSIYEEEYQALIGTMDGRSGTQNMLSQIRRIFTLEDPYQGSTMSQDQAYKDLERLTCTDVKHILEYLRQFMYLASKTGRLFTSSELSSKLFVKMPGDLGKRIEDSFKAKYPGNTVGVFPRIIFSFKYLENQCKEASFQRSLKSLEFCKQMPIPGYYGTDKKRLGIRKATHYKGKPHSTHVKIEKHKHLRTKKCKCYLCGEEGRFARECKNDSRNIHRQTMYQPLELPRDFELVSAEENDSGDEIYSMSEGEDPTTMFMNLTPLAQVEDCLTLDWEYKDVYEYRHFGTCTSDIQQPQPWKQRTKVYEEGGNGHDRTFYRYYGPPDGRENWPETPIPTGWGSDFDSDSDTNDIEDEEIYMMQEEQFNEHWIGKRGGWQPLIKLSDIEFNCVHQWQHNTQVRNCPEHCRCCNKETSDRCRIQCGYCKITACSLCAFSYFDIKVTQRKEFVSPYYATPSLLKENQEYISWCQAELNKTGEAMMHIRKENAAQSEVITAQEDVINKLKEEKVDKEKILKELKQELQQEKEKFLREIEEQKELFKRQIEEEKAKFLSLKQKQTEEEECLLVKEEPEEQKVEETLAISGKLIIIEGRIEIEGVKPFTVKALLDTGAPCCNIKKEFVPMDAVEQCNYPVLIHGVNSTLEVNQKLKQGKFIIGSQEYRLPHTYVLPMNKNLVTDMQMIIGCNFIRSLHGGVRIEGNEVTFYKYLTKLESINLIEDDNFSKNFSEYMLLNDTGTDELRNEQENLRIKKAVAHKLLQLSDMGYIGEEPLKHWKKNQVECKLEIINPQLKIEDKPLKHITPQMQESFNKQVDSLLKLGVIRPSKSPHRTTAFLVKSGTTVDTKTGKETKGKERMVFNYQRLNDNTEKDQYPLPGINTILQRIGKTKIYSKFDLKSGFHQVAMAEESIPWTAFAIPGKGLFEWLVMPFGLKNAPSGFQRKMDLCFTGLEEFVAVYIDDVLIFSNSEQKHLEHLGRFFERVQQHGLVLSPTKMKIGVRKVDFLGTVISNGLLHMQEHILKKIAAFGPEQNKSKKDLRSWLGLINYARNHIPNVGRMLGPIYAKTSPQGEPRMNAQDWKIIQDIQAQIHQLPTLEIPDKDAVIIIETDGCMTGGGAVCKWKKTEKDPKATEKICAYASGPYNPLKSTIDAEISAVLHALETFKIFYLSQPTIIIRTDCQAIISFYNKSFNHKPSRLRWIRLSDWLTGTGVGYKFEHIKGEQNNLADHLSRNPDTALTKLVSTLISEWQDLPEPIYHLLSETLSMGEETQALMTSYLDTRSRSKTIPKHVPNQGKWTNSSNHGPKSRTRSTNCTSKCVKNSQKYTQSLNSTGTQLDPRQQGIMLGETISPTSKGRLKPPTITSAR